MATYYISPTGNDTTGNGSSGTPWATIAKAITGSTNGDTIICKNGTYTWVNQTVFNERTIQAETNGLVIFDASSTEVNWVPGTNVTITGLVFKNANNTGDGKSIFVGDNKGASLRVVVTFNNCQFINLAASNTHFGAHFNISRLGGSQVGNHTMTFNNCLFVNPSSTFTNSGILFNAYSISPNTVTYTFNNTTFYLATTGTARITNIVTSTGGAACYGVTKNSIIYNGSGNTLTAGITTSNYTDAYLVTGMPAGTGNITTDPLFVDAANGNFNLRPTSPCIDTGTLV